MSVPIIVRARNRAGELVELDVGGHPIEKDNSYAPEIPHESPSATKHSAHVRPDQPQDSPDDLHNSDDKRILKRSSLIDTFAFICAVIAVVTVVILALKNGATHSYVIVGAAAVDCWTLVTFFLEDVHSPQHIRMFDEAGLNYEIFALVTVLASVFSAIRVISAAQRTSASTC